MTNSREALQGAAAGETPLRGDPEALRYIPQGFALRHRVLAYGVDGPELCVAVADMAPATVDRIRLLTGMRVKARIFPRATIDRGLSRAYEAHPDSDDEPGATRKLDELGMSAETLTTCRAMLQAQEKFLLVSGPARSGKTTTLGALLAEVADRNSVVVSELDNRRAAKAALSDALGGRLVLAAVRARDAAAALERLMWWTGSARALASALGGILSQRLMRSLCAHCRGDGGCDACEKTGYAGAVAVFECFRANGEVCRALVSESSQSLRLVIERNSRGGLRRDALRRVMDGVTTALEMARLFGAEADGV